MPVPSLPQALDLIGLPSEVARAVDALLAAPTPRDQHDKALALLQGSLTWTCRVLASQYAAHRQVHGPLDPVEQQLRRLHDAGGGPWTLGTHRDLADSIRQASGEQGILHPVPWGKDPSREACKELVAAWEAVKSFWESTEGEQARAEAPYDWIISHTAQARSAHTGLAVVLDRLLNLRNVHAHAAEGVALSPGGALRRLQFSEGYYAALGPRLAAAVLELTASLFGPLANAGPVHVARLEQTAGGLRATLLREQGLGAPRPHEVAGELPDDLGAGQRWLLDADGRLSLRLLGQVRDLLPLDRATGADAALPVASPPPPAELPPPFNVPFRSKQEAFVGRDDQLDALHRLLSEGRRTVVGQAATIHGMGGVGKTQLAVEYAWRYQDHYPGGVAWFDVTADRRSQWAGFAIDALGARTDDKPEYLEARTRVWLHARSDYLLVLDNVREDTDLAGWLPSSQPTVLATARHRLGADWAPLPLQMLSRPAATALLVQGARLDETARGDPAAVDALCAALCDFPLAIELAASWLFEFDLVTVSEYLGLLAAQGLRALDRQGTIGPTQHRASVAATLALDRQRLADRPEVLALVETMALWPAHAADAELLRHMAGLDEGLPFLQALSRARNLSLLQSEPGSKLVAVHPFLQEVVREELDPAGLGARRAAMLSGATEWLAGLKDARHAARVTAAGEGLDALVAAAPTAEGAPTVLRELARHHVWAGQGATAEGLARRALEQLGDGVEPRVRAAVQVVHAGALRLLARYGEAHEQAAAAAAAAPEHEEGAPYLLLECLAEEAWALRDLGRVQEAHQVAERAAALADRRLDRMDLAWARARMDLGSTLLALGRAKEALPHHEAALAARRAVLGQDHPEVAIALNALQSTLLELGRLEESLVLAQDVVTICLATHGDRHPDSTLAHNNLGSVLHALGRHDESLECHTIALHMNQAVLGEQHPHTATDHANIGSVLIDLGRLREALAHKQLALRIRRHTLGERHPTTGGSHSNLAQTCHAVGDHHAALRHKEAALRIAEHNHGPGHPSLVDHHATIAYAHFKLGQYTQALEHIDAALRIVEAQPEPDPAKRRSLREERTALVMKLNATRPGFRQQSTRPRQSPKKPPKRRR